MKSPAYAGFSAPNWCVREIALLYTVRGSGFLKHMVRNIVGTLIETGRGNIAAPEVASLLSGRCSGQMRTYRAS